MSRLLALCLSLFTVAALAGCASSATQRGQGGQGTGSPAPNTSDVSSQPPAQLVRVNESNDGKTVTLHPGDILQLQLHSTYWKIAAPSGNALSQTGKPAYGRRPVDARDCVPGAGCGTVQVEFRAEHPGNAQVRASRTTCGEAMMCSPHTGSYRLTVVVK